MPKEMSLSNLYKDLGYIINGTYVHQFLFKVFPPRPDAMILEPGCGSAKFALSYALAGCRVWALDIDPEVIQYARKIRDALDILSGGFYEKAWIGIGDIHNLKYSDNSFDLVMNEGVPQHWPDEKQRQGSINEMVRVSRSMVVIIGNNSLNPKEQEIDKTFQFGYEGMPPTRRCFTPEELESRMRNAGLVDVSVVGLDGTLDNATTSAILLAGYGRKG